VPRLADASSTVRVAKESHPFGTASLTEKCDKSSSLIFNVLLRWTNGEPTYLSGHPVDGGPLLAECYPVRRGSYSLAGCALDEAPDGGVVHLSVQSGNPFRPTPQTETSDPDLCVLAGRPSDE
jgi:hypothetical protein